MRRALTVVTGFARRYRLRLWAGAAIVALYSLLGFLVVPWWVKGAAVDAVRENLAADLRIENVAINPFVLSLRVDGVELDDPSGARVARVDEVFVNFQASSLFHWAWTFDELRITAPQLLLARDAAGTLNVAAFETHASSPAAAPREGLDSSGPGIPRLLVYDFVIDAAVVDWRDQVPMEPVATRFGPIAIRVQQLNTLPDRAGDQTVVIATETAGTLSWTGSLQLNPLKSAGHAAIRGSRFPLLSAYVRDRIGFEVVQGSADVDFDYSVDTAADGRIRAGVDNFSSVLSDLRVRTFEPTTPDADREVLALPAASLSGGALRWPDQTLSVASLAVDDAAVTIHRDDTGALNVIGNTAQATIEPSEPRPVAASPWHLSLEQLAINRLRFAFEDESVEPPANIGVESLDVAVSDLSNVPDTRFPATVSLTLPSGGRASATGEFGILPQPSFGFDVAVDAAALVPLHPYLNRLVDVDLESGVLDITGRLSRDAQEPLAFTGDLDVDNFLITEADEGSRLGSWSRLHAEKIAFSAADRSLEVSEIRLEQPYGDVLVAEDGSVNLGRVGKATGGEPEGPGGTAAEAAAPPAAEPVEPALAVTIGRVVIANASADFQDQSLPLPFLAKIADLNGEITTIATRSREPSTVALEGKVDEYGFVRITGTVTPLDPAANTDLHVAFQNVEMPKFSAYMIPFAGREIASGRLDLDLGYQVKASELVGENRVVLRDFELGDEVEHPGALSLPLGLAVALLKDKDGKIDVDLPVRGNVDDPEFRYGGVILKALANLIVRIVASPFALLGKLIGVEASELESITFLPGRADLTPPEIERAAKLAEALALRPELELEVSGVVDHEVDGLALRTANLQQLLDARLAADATTDESMYAARQVKALETLFVEAGEETMQRAALQALQTQFTSAAGGEGAGANPQLDSLAYGSEIRRQLIELQAITDAELAALADERAANTRAAVLQADATLDARVVFGDAEEVESKPDEPIAMRVKLTAAAAE